MIFTSSPPAPSKFKIGAGVSPFSVRTQVCFRSARSASLFLVRYGPKKDLHGLWRAFAPQALFRSAASFISVRRLADLRTENKLAARACADRNATYSRSADRNATYSRSCGSLAARARNVLPALQYACGSLAARAERSPRAAIRARIVGCARGMFSPRRNTRADRWLRARNVPPAPQYA